MKHPIQQIRIPEPCAENWEQMLPEEKGRHCEKCAKTVVDFTGMSDATVLNYLMQNQNTCGRFDNRQLNRELIIPRTESVLSKFGRRITLAGLFALQLWPRRGEAQVVAADTISTSKVINQQEVHPVFVNYSYVRGKVVQPDSVPLRALKLQFRIDTFHLEVEVDSSGVFNFQCPAGLKRDTAEVKIFTGDSVFVLNVLNMHDYGFLSLSVFEHAGELMLVYDKTWTYYLTSPTLPPFSWTWGAPIVRPWVFLPPFPDSVQTFVTSAGNWVIDTVEKKDTAVPVIKKEKKWKKKEGVFTSMAWAATLLSVLAAFVFWVRREKKVEQNEGQSESEGQNQHDS